MSALVAWLRRWRGGLWGLALVGSIVVVALALIGGLYLRPSVARGYGLRLAYNSAMFGPAIAQPIAFSHRLHVSDKEIDCLYCHSTAERSLNAGIPPRSTCLGCHDHIIPEHEEIRKLRSYSDDVNGVPWVRVYYNPDHVFFPHYRHLQKGVTCQECHAEVERVDRLHQVTFYMGFCLDCHRQRQASVECVACHQ